MTPGPDVSVALVTRNRPSQLHRCLSSLAGQSVAFAEVVVSDDSDAADVRAATRDVVAEFGHRYLEGPRRGLYANRNFAAAACSGSHVRTMDDDHTFPPRHVEDVTAAVVADPDCVWVIGEVQPGEPVDAGRRCPPQLTARGWSRPPRRGEQLWAIADGASVYPRAVLDRGLHYEEAFLFGAAYLELGARLHHHGVRIRHLDTTYVEHHLTDERSFQLPAEELAARIFAATRFAFTYQPTALHRLAALGEIARRAVTQRGGIAAVRRGIAAARRDAVQS